MHGVVIQSDISGASCSCVTLKILMLQKEFVPWR